MKQWFPWLLSIAACTGHSQLCHPVSLVMVNYSTIPSHSWTIAKLICSYCVQNKKYKCSQSLKEIPSKDYRKNKNCSVKY